MLKKDHPFLNYRQSLSFKKLDRGRQMLCARQTNKMYLTKYIFSCFSYFQVYMRDRTEWFANNHYCDNVLLPGLY